MVLSSSLFASSAASVSMSVYAFFSGRAPEVRRSIENFADDARAIAYKEARAIKVR